MSAFEEDPTKPGSDDESDGFHGDNGEADGTDPLAGLMLELESVKTSESKLRDQLQRLAAEFDNYRKRSRQDAEATARARNEALLAELLDVLDNFERGFEADTAHRGPRAFRAGMELVYKRFREILERCDVEELNPEGEEFDPNLHEAVHAEKRDGTPPNRVLQVIQKGYRVGDRLLRPARVMVST